MSEHDESGDSRESDVPTPDSTPDSTPTSTPDSPDDTERARRRWPWVVAAIAVLGVIVVAAVALLTVPSIRTIQQSAPAAQAHLVQAKEALTANDAAAARASVSAARDDVAAARSAADVLPLRVASYIPVVSSPVADVNHLIAAADSTVSASDELVSAYAATLGPSGGSGLFQDGAVDLTALASLTTAVSTAVDHLNIASGELDQVSASLPGTGQLAQARDFARDEIEPLRTTLGALDAALPSVPDALGKESPRRYLLAVLNPAELRASGGAPLSVALLTITNGKISVSEQGQTSTELTPGNPYLVWNHVTGPPFSKGNSRSRFANANAHADFRLSGEELMRAWEASGKPAVDGVIAIDTTAIVEALRATGPVTTEGFGTVSAKDFVDKWIDSYRLFESDPLQRQSINDELATALIARVTGGDSVFDIVRSMASTAPGRHLQVTMRTPELQRVVEEAGFAGMVSATTGDHAAWYSLNINASKTDLFSDRALTVNAVLDSDGGATVTQTMTATNNVPAWFGNGQNVGYLTSWNASRWLVYVPTAAVDEKLAIPVGWRKVSPWNDGLDKRFLLTSGWLDRGESATLTLTYTLPAGTFADGVYRLVIDPQATLRPTMATVTVTHPNASPVTALAPTPVDRILTVTSAP